MELSWSSPAGVSAHRLTLRDSEGAVLLDSGALNRPEFSFDERVLKSESGPVLGSLEMKRADGSWVSAGPQARLPAEPQRGTPVRWESAAAIHRLVVFDRTAAKIVLDEIVLGDSYPFHCPPDVASHDLAMSVRPWTGDGWGEPGKWGPLPLRIVLGARRQTQPVLDAESPPELLLAFTVDTECSILRQRDPDPDRVVDQLIFGDFGDGARNGIDLHMDLLEHFGHRGCFFLDILMEHRFGRAAIERIVEAVRDRGHELQLHVHPEHLLRSPDQSAFASGAAWAAREPDAFARVLEHSMDLFVRATGDPPVAYRAGGYRIVEEHFPILERAGIRIDSSVNPHVNFDLPDWMRTRTQPYWVGGILEAPPTWIVVQDDPERWEPRAFAPNATLGDPVTPISPVQERSSLLATYVSHSFELLQTDLLGDSRFRKEFERRLRKRVSSDEAEGLLGQIRGPLRLHDGTVDGGAVAACAGVLRRIADRTDARCITYSEMAESAERLWPRDESRGPDPIPAVDRRRGVAAVVLSDDPRVWS